MLIKIPVVNNDFSSLKAFTALNISIITNTVKDIVDGFSFAHVKYPHGSFDISYSKKSWTLKSSVFQAGHSDQFLN